MTYDTAIFIGKVSVATSSLGSGTMNSMKKNGNHSMRNTAAPRLTSTTAAITQMIALISNIKICCERPIKYSPSPSASSGQPVHDDAGGVAGHLRATSHSASAKMIGPWPCSSPIQAPVNRS